MNIFLHATPDYVRHAVETIYSIRINSRKNLNVYLLIDMPDVSTVQNLIDGMRLENTDIHCVSNTGFNARNGIKYENDGWPSIIFSKFYIFEILPPDIDKLLLIDCDAFVLKPDIDCFYDEDIS